MNVLIARHCLLVLLLLASWIPVARAEESFVVQSPSKNHSIRLALLEGMPYYSVSFEGVVILENSRLSLSVDGDLLKEKFVVEGSRNDSQSGSWNPVVGSKSTYPDSYNECVVQLREAGGKRARSENSELRFPADHFVYWDDYPQAKYARQRISEMGNRCIRPLLVETEKHFVAIAEAGTLENYAPMMLDRNGNNRLLSRFRRGTVTAASPMSTPWRVIMAADKPGTLVENHYLLQNLSEPWQWARHLDSSHATSIALRHRSGRLGQSDGRRRSAPSAKVVGLLRPIPQVGILCWGNR